MSQLTIEQLQGQLAIDKSVLDDEIIRQPGLFYAISEMLTQANAERDGAKEELAKIDAEVAFKVRTKLAKGTVRATDKLVESHVLISPEHEDAFMAYLEAKTRAEKLDALKNAFQQRSYMLRDLVSLYAANYYEVSSIKPTKMQEASQYAANRTRISNARAARGT